MKILQLLLTILFIYSAKVYAQEQKDPFKNGKISGNLIETTKTPVPFANVLLVFPKDSSLYKVVVSDENGHFEFNKIAEGTYLLSISAVGFKTYYSPKFILSENNSSIQFENIQITADSKLLSAVTVTAKKPLVEMQADKMVLNVENSIIATGGNVMELLEKAPGVTVDNNDNISLKGKSGILIYMDGKPTYLSQSDLANLLKNMNSDQIEKIEIISNPSSKYDASGKAIINIVTKKNKNFGTNGSITIGTGLGFLPSTIMNETNLNKDGGGTKPRYNTSLTLNNRKGKFNLFGNFSYNHGEGGNTNIIKRTVDSTLYNQYAYRLNTWDSYSYKAGVDYFLSKKTTIGILMNGNLGNWGNPVPAKNNAYIKNIDNELISSPITTTSGYGSWKGNTFNTNFKHTFDSTGKELTADFDYSLYNNLDKERGLITHFYDAFGKEYGTPLNITSNIPNKYNILAFKTDFAMPLAKIKSKIEMGGKSSFVKSDNDIKFYNNLIPDLTRTNHFIYQENVNALYGNFSKEISKKLSLQTGLRVENTHSEGNSLTVNQVTKRNYTNFFPSFFLKQVVNKNNELSYTFSRRIERPDYASLNPFVGFLDPYTYELGNIYLRPQYTNSYEINHTFKGAYITTLGYSQTTNYMIQIIKNAIDDPIIFEKIKASSAGTDVDPTKVTFVIKENLAKYQNFNINFVVPIKFTEWWNANNNVTGFYNRFEGIANGKSLNYDKSAYNFNTNHIITLPKSSTLEVSMWYNSPNVYGQMLMKSQYAVNLGLKKTIWNKKADLKLKVNDLLRTNRFVGTINQGGVLMNLSSHWTSQSVMLSFVYKFGNSNVKAERNRSTATADEQNRVKTGN